MIAWGAALPAPAKLNLFLHVIGRRDDGYHLLQTVFRLIEYCDTLRFEPRTDGRIRLTRPLEGVAEDDDLTVRAARALQAHVQRPLGATITLEKRVPIGAGLGGGSSDAATTLVALNRLWEIGLPIAELAAIGARLGADVPVFVRGHSAFGEGIGELLTPVDLSPAWYLVLIPPVAIATREIFASPDLTRDTKPTTISAFFADQICRNDLADVVVVRYPVVGRYLEWLGQYAPARMSGSGSAVFAEFPTEDAARAVRARLRGDMQGFVARGLDRHPLSDC